MEMDIEEFFEKPYWVVDILPKQVPGNQQQSECQQDRLEGQGAKEKRMPESKGQYFRIEEYFLEHPRIDAIHRKFTHILLKLNCYEDFFVSQDGEEWTTNPAPEDFETMMSKCLSENRMLYVRLKSEETLITVSGDDTYMTVYHPSEDTLELLGSLATSEGFFVWKPVC